jgi:threonine/homoserine/homoserine lactone efflux protein
MDFFLHFLIGLVVSFLGSLPLGTVNLAVVQTTINSNFRAGFYFALGATLVELIYSAIAIKFIAVLLSNSHLELIIQIFTVPAFIILGILYFRKKESGKAETVKGRRSFLNGMFIGLINPLQIPFWLAYGSYLLTNNWIKNEAGLLNLFILGICTGTLMVLTLIALISKTLISKIDLRTNLVNKGIGIILFILATYQLVKIVLQFI